MKPTAGIVALDILAAPTLAAAGGSLGRDPNT